MHRLMQRGKALYARRKETVERSFADAKQLHGHRYAKMRGLPRVREQCLLCAAAQNIKKIALLAGKSLQNRFVFTLQTLFFSFQSPPCLIPAPVRTPPPRYHH
jgi:hypothetical protein